jgi:DNA mismatch repair ATPase MutS
LFGLRIIEELHAEVAMYASDMSQLCEALANLDLVAGLAEVAHQHHSMSTFARCGIEVVALI